MGRLVVFFLFFLILSYTGVQAVDIQVIESSVGVKGWLSQEAESPPVIAIEMAWEGGSTQDPVGKEGLACLAAAALTEGAGDMKAQAFHEAWADLAASVACYADADTTRCQVRLIGANRADVFRLLRMMLVQPRFDDEAIERLKLQFHNNIRSNLENPEWLARRSFYEAAFGQHPYAHAADGTHASIDAITGEDMKRAIHNVLARDNVHIAIVGPMQADETRALLKTLFESLPAQAHLIHVPDVTWNKGASKKVSINNPQTVCVFGVPAPGSHDKDNIPARVLNYVLGGGGFSSRIMDEVREKRGLAYSPYTILAQWRHMSGFIGTVGTEKERIDQSLVVINQVFEDLSKNGVETKELDDAKRAITGSYGRQFNSNSRKATYLLDVQLKGFGVDYIQTYPRSIEAVAVSDIQRVASAYLATPLTQGCAGV